MEKELSSYPAFPEGIMFRKINGWLGEVLLYRIPVNRCQGNHGNEKSPFATPMTQWIINEECCNGGIHWSPWSILTSLKMGHKSPDEVQKEVQSIT